MGVFVVDAGHAPEPLVARHVPQLDVDSPLPDAHLLLSEVQLHGDPVLGAVVAVHVAPDDRGLPHTDIADDHDLDDIICHLPESLTDCAKSQFNFKLGLLSGLIINTRPAGYGLSIVVMVTGNSTTGTFS